MSRYCSLALAISLIPAAILSQPAVDPAPASSMDQTVTPGAGESGGESTPGGGAPSPATSSPGRPIEDAESLALLARAEEHFFKQRYNIAMRLFRMLMAREPENPAAYRFAGDIQLALGKAAEAEQYFQLARELSDRPAEEWFRIAQSRYLQADGPGAMAALQETRQADPQLMQALFLEGIVQFRIFRNKRAVIAAWEEYRRLRPDDPQGPAIDAAIAILKRADYEIPEENGTPRLPDGSQTRRPYQPASPPAARPDDTPGGAELLDEL
ncbi:MAG: hypothetical protein K1X75_04435 [Leptospirales bacterium]|nr:hypothetical protein [Leptospirales bacterium]